MELQRTEFRFYPGNESRVNAEIIGFRFGDKGTHTSRTMMLAELEAVLDATSETAEGASAIKCWWLPRNPLVC